MTKGRQPVRRVIQHKRTGDYLMESGEWTPDIEQALHLPSVVAAVRLVRRLDLKDVQVVLNFNGGQDDVRLDL